jgi:hypothetical protein
MIQLLELILYFNQQLEEHPPAPTFDWLDICSSTLAYLNAYRQTVIMLEDIARDAVDLKRGS